MRRRRILEGRHPRNAFTLVEMLAVIAIIVIDWTRFARVVRAETQLQRQLDYVAAAKVLGLSRRRILVAEVLPNLLPVILTLLTAEMVMSRSGAASLARQSSTSHNTSTARWR